jgi:hypothetical protein
MPHELLKGCSAHYGTALRAPKRENSVNHGVDTRLQMLCAVTYLLVSMPVHFCIEFFPLRLFGKLSIRAASKRQAPKKAAHLCYPGRVQSLCHGHCPRDQVCCVAEERLLGLVLIDIWQVISTPE